MFALAVNAVVSLHKRGLLTPGWIYRCEFLAKAKHNVLTYSRVPACNLVLFDVYRPDISAYCTPRGKIEAAAILGLEPVRCLHSGLMWTDDARGATLDQLMQAESSLGGTKIEGVVIKNYANATADGPQVAKIVSAEFKEKHAHGPINPKAGQGEHLAQIIAHLRTEARWRKAIQHLRETNALTNGPEDIGPLMKELATDILAEETDAIKQALFDAFWKTIVKGVSAGFPDFYKKILAQNSTEPSAYDEFLATKQTNETKEKV
jgi:hypothetical protein